MKRNFKGIWIPAELWINKDLSFVEKIMLWEIDSLDDPDQGGCYASNGYFAEFFQLSKSRVSEIISSLSKKKYVKTLLVRYTEQGHIKTRRLIKPTKKTLRKTEDTPSGSRKGQSESQKGYSENGECINTSDKSNIAPALSLEERRAKNKKMSEFLDRMGIYGEARRHWLRGSGKDPDETGTNPVDN